MHPDQILSDALQAGISRRVVARIVATIIRGVALPHICDMRTHLCAKVLLDWGNYEADDTELAQATVAAGVVARAHWTEARGTWRAESYQISPPKDLRLAAERSAAEAEAAEAISCQLVRHVALSRWRAARAAGCSWDVAEATHDMVLVDAAQTVRQMIAAESGDIIDK